MKALNSSAFPQGSRKNIVACSPASQTGGFSIDVTWYSFGPYIHTIDGVSDSGYYWGLYHNGEYSMIGAGDLQLQDGDVVLWKLEVANW